MFEFHKKPVLKTLVKFMHDITALLVGVCISQFIIVFPWIAPACAGTSEICATENCMMVEELSNIVISPGVG